MTPRPEIEITEEKELDYIVEQRKLHLEYCLMHTPLYFDTVFESWRMAHLARIGKPEDYVSYDDYIMAKLDPDPYDKMYIFFCLGK